ncbi:MAG: hypothetical protein P8I03_02565 [Thalassotalea sp.]|nr:hypothetical protein [Thalassotalea sp.]
MDAHGEIVLLWQGDLLTVNAKGPFNELGMQNTVETIRDSVLSKNLEAWRKIEIWDEQTLGSPHVISLAESASQWYKDNGCIASAVVVSNCIQNQIIKNISNNTSMTFQNEAAAVNWLNTQIA